MRRYVHTFNEAEDGPVRSYRVRVWCEALAVVCGDLGACVVRVKATSHDQAAQKALAAPHIARVEGLKRVTEVRVITSRRRCQKVVG